MAHSAKTEGSPHDNCRVVLYGHDTLGQWANVHTADIPDGPAVGGRNKG